MQAEVETGQPLLSGGRLGGRPAGPLPQRQGDSARRAPGRASCGRLDRAGRSRGAGGRAQGAPALHGPRRGGHPAGRPGASGPLPRSPAAEARPPPGGRRRHRDLERDAGRHGRGRHHPAPPLRRAAQGPARRGDSRPPAFPSRPSSCATGPRPPTAWRARPRSPTPSTASPTASAAASCLCWARTATSSRSSGVAMRSAASPRPASARRSP